MGNFLSYSCNGLGDKLLQSCADGDLISVRQVSLFDVYIGVSKVGSRVVFHSQSEFAIRLAAYSGAGEVVSHLATYNPLFLTEFKHIVTLLACIS